MKRVLIAVEGQTEETFVKEVLMSHLINRNLALIPSIVKTKVVKSGPDFKGGVTSYQKAKRHIQRLLGDTGVVAVTTMFDLYGLPDDFPGYGSRPTSDCYAKVSHLEKALGEDINDPRFQAYLQLHEFEAFLFVDPAQTAANLPGFSLLDDLVAIKTAFNSPEEINDEPETTPSSRLLELYPRYQKRSQAPIVTKNVGLDRLRQGCPHFNEWLTWLEGLGSD